MKNYLVIMSEAGDQIAVVSPFCERPWCENHSNSPTGQDCGDNHRVNVFRAVNGKLQEEDQAEQPFGGKTEDAEDVTIFQGRIILHSKGMPERHYRVEGSQLVRELPHGVTMIER